MTIKGYEGHAMESPFLSRDGRFLLFNNRNQKPDNTNLHWAERIDDLTFQYRGEIAGANTEALEGVPTLDQRGMLYFVSPRSYEQTLSTLYQGKWQEGAATDGSDSARRDFARNRKRWVQFDVEVTPDGNTLYAVNCYFRPLGATESTLFISHRNPDGTWKEDPRSGEIMKLINEPDHLQYAAAISADELTLYFNRVQGPMSPFSRARIWVTHRSNRDEPVGPPRLIHACAGFVEGATVAPDNRAIYYHKLDGQHFVIERLERK